MGEQPEGEDGKPEEEEDEEEPENDAISGDE